MYVFKLLEWGLIKSLEVNCYFIFGNNNICNFSNIH